MIIKNNTSKRIVVLLNNKAYSFNAGDSLEVTEEVGSWLLSVQPLLSAVKTETVEIHTEPVEMEKKEEPKQSTKTQKSKKKKK